jgi:hypothetical protein
VRNIEWRSSPTTFTKNEHQNRRLPDHLRLLPHAHGLAVYLSNPEKAKMALMSGGTFGAISILWGVLRARGVRWSPAPAMTTTSLLAVVFAWRANTGWLALLDRAYAEAKEILTQHRSQLDGVAAELLNRETLEGADFYRMIGIKTPSAGCVAKV